MYMYIITILNQWKFLEADAKNKNSIWNDIKYMQT